MPLKKLLFETANQLIVGDIQGHFRELNRGNPANLSQKYLRGMLLYAAGSNPYYRQLYIKNPVPELSDFPLLTKQIIREKFQLLKSYRTGTGLYVNSSGGSTGQPINLLQDREFNSWSRAAEKYYFEKFLGINYESTGKVILWGSDRDAKKQQDWKGKTFNWLSNSVFLNTFNVSERSWLDYAEIINKTRPYFIKGYAGSLYQLSRIIKQHNLKIYRPKFIYSSAETLRDFMRKEIESVFSAKVFDYYGSREVGAIAGECKSGRRHIFNFNNFLEILPKGGEGRVLITNLHNFSMPLIRYDLGDSAVMGRGVCPCGSGLPWLAKITGRITDHFKTKNGTLVHGEYFTHLFYGVDWLREFRIVQKDYLVIEILAVLNGKKDQQVLSCINRNIRLLMGKNCRITWKWVDRIPSTAQGKHLYTISEINA